MELKEHDNGIKYYSELLEDYILLTNYKELFVIGNDDAVLTTNNAQIRIDLQLIVYNPQTKEYYPRWLHIGSDRQQLYQYYKDGNLFINKNDLTWDKNNEQKPIF